LTGTASQSSWASSAAEGVPNSSARLLGLSVALLSIFSTASAQDAKATVYKIPEAGIQVNLPPGWDAEKNAKGVVVISRKETDGYVVFSLSVLNTNPSLSFDELFTAFSQGVLENVKKDWKSFRAGSVMKNTQGGMAVRAQKFAGNSAESGGDLEGLVIIVDSPKPLGIFVQRTKNHSAVLETEGDSILSSIAKIP
jgi:hypothetical protein